MRVLETVRSILVSLVSLILLAILVGGLYFGYTFYERTRNAQAEVERKLAQKDDELKKLSAELETTQADLKHKEGQIAQLSSDLQAAHEELQRKEKEIRRLNTAIQLLKVDRRVAFLDVLAQEKDDSGQQVKTTVRFLEVDHEGRPIEAPRTFVVAGDVVYVDALVVKFADHFVEEGDPLRAASLCLFQRIFGNNQSPEQGARIDRENDSPAVYRTSQVRSDFERELWMQFWELAKNQEKAREKGIRAAHGEAVYVQAVPGTRYRVSLRASDGLSIVPEGPVPDLPGKTL